MASPSTTPRSSQALSAGPEADHSPERLPDSHSATDGELRQALGSHRALAAQERQVPAQMVVMAPDQHRPSDRFGLAASRATRF